MSKLVTYWTDVMLYILKDREYQPDETMNSMTMLQPNGSHDDRKRVNVRRFIDTTLIERRFFHALNLIQLTSTIERT